jgi:molecular chaperone HtpG
MLQATPVLTRIRRAVTGRVISELTARAKDAEDFAGFWENFGPILKEGIYEDHERRNEIAPLLRFHSSAVEGWTSLTDYASRMKDGQEAIYYLVADDPEALAKSPQLEGFRARGIEVLLLSDHVDAFWPEQLGKFDDKPLRSVTKGSVDLSKFNSETRPPETADITGLVNALKAALQSEVSDVRATDRLVESAVVLAAASSGPDLQMQRMLRRAGRSVGAGLPLLEINPHHPLIQSLARRAEASEDLSEAAGTLLDLARVQDGDTPRDPVAFSRRVAAALADSLDAG